MIQKNIKFLLLIGMLNFTFFFSHALFAQQINSGINSTQLKSLLSKWKNPLKKWEYLGVMSIDSSRIQSKEKKIKVYFSKPTSFVPLREDSYNELLQSVNICLDAKAKNYTLELYCGNYLISDLIPNFYRKTVALDAKRMAIAEKEKRIPIVRKVDNYIPKNGLFNNNIALWHSHGYYYESELDRWEWQRARLFGTVEDLATSSFVLPYLVPMLENAGANVFIPRERDFQPLEVIVDNDRSTHQSELVLPKDLKYNKKQNGFLLKDTLFTANNPFKLGSCLELNPSENKNKIITYLPEIPATGNFALYISYSKNQKNAQQVKYTIQYKGGKSIYMVNQRIGGATWIYLGNFLFEKGKNSQTASVQIEISGNEDGYISFDAIKIGGGMGNVARKPSEELIPKMKSVNDNGISKADTLKVNSKDFGWKISGKSRYAEGARYFMQYAGMPDSLTWNLNNNKNDYNDDYQSRGEWVNYLTGKTRNWSKNNSANGLNIPVDLALAFHTDAGITTNDSIIGTLAIYSSTKDGTIFPNGQSKLASRDLSDLIQTQIVDDIQTLFNPKWTRRGLWDKQYSESWRPIVPTMLLELLSHQNLADVKFCLDPRFRFAVGRAIYKGMVKFIASEEKRSYCIQPLPVTHFGITLINDKNISLSWKPQNDRLEPTAKPTKYKVYMRIGNNSFDNGILVEDTVININLNEYDNIYSFKVTAINEGGESFPSEILAAGLTKNSTHNVLIVNAFNRISGPEYIDNPKTAGIAWWDDLGVPYINDPNFVGNQYDFVRNSAWLDDDNPGWGSSYGNMEGKIILGNNFDNTYIHGQAVLSAGFSFISISNDVFCSKKYNLDAYKTIDIILGEQKTTNDIADSTRKSFKIYTPDFMFMLAEINSKGKNLFMSGAYVGSDINQHDSTEIKFAKNTLHFTWRTGHAVTNGKFYSTDYVQKWMNTNAFFNTIYHSTIYTVETPDAIEPDGTNSFTAFRYGENNTSAGILYDGKNKSVILGFPFETITDTEKRNDFMKQILNFFTK